MRHETVVLIVDSREQFDYMAPIIARELNTTHLLHRDNEQDAVVLVHSHEPLDMVFMDWDVAGPALLSALRHLQDTHYIPVVAMSHSDRDDVIADAMRAGSSDHLAKPFLEKALVTKLRRITKNQERRRLRRIRPVGDYHVAAAIDGRPPLQLPLVDISAGGCQTRAPASVCREVCIYQGAELAIAHEGEVVNLGGQVMRVAKDPAAGFGTDTVLLAFEFTDVEQNRDELFGLLDSLRESWQPGAEAGRE